MKTARRRFLGLAAGGALVTSLRSMGAAQAYPGRPIHLVVGLAPGGVQDLLARMLADPLSQRLGQPVVVENRAGAGTNIATEAVARAAPDGYTLLLVGAPNAINATLYDNLPFDFSRDIAPVAPLATTPEVLLAHPALPVRSVSDLVAFARAHPGQLNIASPGNGTGPHLSAELFKMLTAVELTHVPYRGGAPALTDLLAGRVQLMFVAPALVLEHIATQRVRALGVTSATRCPVLPEVPCIADRVPGFESGGFFGIGVPARTTLEVVERLTSEIDAVLALPPVEQRIHALAAIVWRGTAQDLRLRMERETAKWAAVIRALHLRPT